jgi:5,5'-dehydrodivanillate O-demethylase oxygenase subunit
MTPEQNERLCRVGPGTPGGEMMRRYWHPILASSQLPEPGTKAIRLLGEDLVLYRDRQGRVGVVQPHCAHRRAGLVFGIPDQEGLRCTYHGWLYDATGHCLEQPFESYLDPNATYHERIRIKAYPAEELAGLIFVYLGPEPRPLLPRWEAFIRDGVIREIGIAMLPCNWLQAVENVGDGTHVVYTHWHFSRYVMERLGRPDLVRTTASTEFGRLPEKGIGQFGWGNVIFPYTDVQGDTYQIRVPVDDTHTLHVWYTYYDVEDEQFAHVPVAPQPDSVSIPWFEVPMAGLTEQGEPTWPLLDNNSGQDLTMWYTQGPIVDRSQEHLGNGDRNIIQLRQYVEEQIRLVEAGKDPVNVFRDPAANVCLTPSVGFTRQNRTPDGRIDLTTAARKYSPLLMAAVAAEQGAAALAEPVH